MWSPRAPFVDRVAALPVLGVGLSTEFGATAASGTDPVHLREQHPEAFAFLEIGADLARGIDAATARWIARGWPTTWHFLDVNLEEPEDLDAAWVADTARSARAAGAAWLCGDAGLWHVGPRDRGHGTLLPPVFCAVSADAMAEAVRHLRAATGLEVLPENPPGHALVGDLHPLAYYARVADRADCGLLLDVAHLAIVQRALGLAPTFGLDRFPLERVVEVHVAGGRPFVSGSRTFVDDDHGPEVVRDTWEILEVIVPRLTALRAVVVEAERNPEEVVLALLDRVRAAVRSAPGLNGAASVPPVSPAPWPDASPVDHRRVQRTLFRTMLDPDHADALLAESELGVQELGWLRALDADAVRADPGGRRADQLLGNVGLEFVHTVRADPGLLSAFLGSREMHDALATDGLLVTAFAVFAAGRVRTPLSRALLALDAALAEARRRPAERESAVGQTLARNVRVLELPSGTVDAATALRNGAPVEPLRAGTERVLVIRTDAGPHRPADLAVEVLSEGLGALLAALPLDAEGRCRFAAAHELSPREVDDLVASLVADGIVADR